MQNQSVQLRSVQLRSVQLRIVGSDRSCIFCLADWDNSLLSAEVAYPDQVMRCYDEWHRAYLNFYRDPRGRKEAGGAIAFTPPDSSAALEQAKVNLLTAFETWLKDGALLDIRDRFIQLTQPAPRSPKGSLAHASVHLFLSCNSVDLARLPWENWSLVTDRQSDRAGIRLFRTQAASEKAPASQLRPVQRRKPRILVIIGEDGQLDFQKDFAAIQQKLARKVDLQRIGWQRDKTAIALKQELATAIADPNGWDILYFAGHSNETEITGGELAIAPGVALQISEIRDDLETAIRQGLCFAFFNSCSGITIADTLVQLGLSQVAVMREPIANAVAQHLLLLFLDQLAQHQNVADALTQVCQHFKTSTDRFQYPSAYLVPSLYCTPESSLFHFPHKNWRHRLKLWMPTRWEAIAVSSIVFLSLFYPVQDWLIAKRLLMQAVYRDISNQVPTEQPPVLLVQIDKDSIEKARIVKPAFLTS